MKTDFSFTREDVLTVLNSISDQLRMLGVERIGIFGSFARNEPAGQSDVDILVEFEPNKRSYDNFIDVCFLLEDKLGRRVDVVTPEALSPYMKPAILREIRYVPLAA